MPSPQRPYSSHVQLYNGNENNNNGTKTSHDIKLRFFQIHRAMNNYIMSIKNNDNIFLF